MLAFESAVDYVLGAVGHRIRRCHQISVGLFAEEVGPYGLTTIQYAALAAISARTDLDATRLAELVAFDRSTVGIVLKSLEAKGLIERELRTHDKRTKRLRATAAGLAIVRDAAPAVERSQLRFLDVLDTSERAAFMQLLATVIARHEEHR